MFLTVFLLVGLGGSGTKFFFTLTGGETVYEVFALRGEGYTQVFTISHKMLKKRKMIQEEYLCFVYAAFRHVSSHLRSTKCVLLQQYP